MRVVLILLKDLPVPSFFILQNGINVAIVERQIKMQLKP